jgi:hypothetical protein
MAALFPHAETVKRARELLKAYPDPATRHPLFGIPFSIKDSIDIKGVPTTAACPAYAYVAEKDAPSYATLIEAGCIAIGKVNLVRLISGRSPVPCLIHSFAQRINQLRYWLILVVGCDHHMASQLLYSPRTTSLVAPLQAHAYQLPPIKSPSHWPLTQLVLARVPAAFNNIIGFKPTRGTVSPVIFVKIRFRNFRFHRYLQLEWSLLLESRLHCHRSFQSRRCAHCLEYLFKIDERRHSPKFLGLPGLSLLARSFNLKRSSSSRFHQLIQNPASWSRKSSINFSKQAVLLVKAIGGQLVNDVDYTVFEDAGRLLYEGSFVAERVSGVREWYDAHPAPTSQTSKMHSCRKYGPFILRQRINFPL